MQEGGAQLYPKCGTLDTLELPELRCTQDEEFGGVVDSGIFDVHDGLRGGTSVWSGDRMFSTS